MYNGEFKDIKYLLFMDLTDKLLNKFYTKIGKG